MPDFSAIKPGTYGVVDRSGAVGAAIRLSTRSPWSHAFVAVESGLVVEAEGHGARVAPLSSYEGCTVAFNDEEPLTAAQRSTIAIHAVACVGVPYGFLDLLGLAMNSWLGLEPRWFVRRVQAERRLICSQLVARAYYLGAGIDLACGRPDAMVTPADLGMRIATRPWETSEPSASAADRKI